MLLVHRGESGDCFGGISEVTVHQKVPSGRRILLPPNGVAAAKVVFVGRKSYDVSCGSLVLRSQSFDCPWDMTPLPSRQPELDHCVQILQSLPRDLSSRPPKTIGEVHVAAVGLLYHLKVDQAALQKIRCEIFRWNKEMSLEYEYLATFFLRDSCSHFLELIVFVCVLQETK